MRTSRAVLGRGLSFRQNNLRAVTTEGGVSGRRNHITGQCGSKAQPRSLFQCCIGARVRQSQWRTAATTPVVVDKSRARRSWSSSKGSCSVGHCLVRRLSDNRVIMRKDVLVPRASYDGHVHLGEELWNAVGRPVGMPHLEERALKLLDEAISILNPPEAHVRVVEVDTFTESERSIVKGGVPIGHGDYSLRQKTVILKRMSSARPDGDGEPAPVAGDDSRSGAKEGTDTAFLVHLENAATAADAVEMTALTKGAAEAAARVAERDAKEAMAKTRPKLPEIILFWGRNKRTGGNLVVCPDKSSMDRLIQAYLVCEVVQDSKLHDRSVTSLSERLTTEREGALMSVELGETSAAEQDALENLISDYSFHDAAIGIISLTASIYYFAVLGRNDVNVLTLLAVAVVAGLNQEATWPWVFKQILRCARMKDPIIRVTQCRQVRHHQGQLSGQGFLAIGLAAFGVYLEVFPADDGETPILFRIFLNGFQGAMLAVLVVNMVQAVEPMALSEIRPKDRLKPWARRYLDDNVFDTKWYLTLLVGALWAGIIAVVITHLQYDADLGWDVTIVCLVVLGLSLASVNPGMTLLCVWGLIWLIPVGLAFVFRSAFDTTLMLINKATLTWRRMANEVAAHGRGAVEKFSVRGAFILLAQVLPLTPLFLVTLPIPLLYIFVWLIHLAMRVFLRVGDAVIFPVSDFRLHPILSDYGSVTWKMSRLSMDVEDRSMRAMLEARIAKLMTAPGSTFRERVEDGTLPSRPYWHLSKCSSNRLGCIAIVMGAAKEAASKSLLVSPSYETRAEIEASGEAAANC